MFSLDCREVVAKRVWSERNILRREKEKNGMGSVAKQNYENWVSHKDNVIR